MTGLFSLLDYRDILKIRELRLFFLNNIDFRTKQKKEAVQTGDLLYAYDFIRLRYGRRIR